MDLSTFESIRDKLGGSRLGKPALIGLAVIVIMVAVLAGRSVFDTATASTFEISHESSGVPSSQSTHNTDENQCESVFVHVAGCVANPGLYELEKGSRIADAINAAGGPTDEAAADGVNLARTVNDGEQVIVPAIGPDPVPEDHNASTATPTAAKGKVNINTASQSDLESLPGIGASTAAKIIADRNASGPFSSPEELKRVSGIGDKKFEALSDLICV